jgi:hypothetical protein
VLTLLDDSFVDAEDIAGTDVFASVLLESREAIADAAGLEDQITPTSGSQRKSKTDFTSASRMGSSSVGTGWRRRRRGRGVSKERCQRVYTEH